MLNRFKILIVFVLVIAAVPVFAQQEVDISSMPPIMNRIMLRQGRFELSPSLGITLNDEYSRSVLFDLTGAYHIKEWMGVGLELIYGQPVKTWLAENIEEQIGGGFTISRSYVNLLIVPYVQFTPLSGKFVLANKVLGYGDIHIDLGAGMSYVGATGALSAKTTWTFMFGGGARFFVIQNMSVNLTFHDYLIDRILCLSNASNVKATSKITNNLAIMLGVSIFFPKNTTRSYK